MYYTSSIAVAAVVALCSVLVWRLSHAVQTNKQLFVDAGLPIVVSPVDPVSPLWMVLQKAAIPLLRMLPFGWGDFTRHNYMGWAFDDKYKIHEELGDMFVHITPGENELYIADAAVAHDVFLRRKDFVKPINMYKMLEIFGKNVDTVEGQEWNRHRKITAPPFNERNSELVWTESLRQAEEMLDYWCETSAIAANKDSTDGNLSLKKPGFNTIVKDTMILSLHVLTCAGFGMSYTFRSALSPPKRGFTMTYRDSLSIVLENVLLVLALPHKALSLPIMPKDTQRVGAAIGQFKQYMVEMVEAERQKIKTRLPGEGNLMSSLVRGSEEKKLSAMNGSSNAGLTDEEIFGNIFLYNLAGHETTANTLAYSILLLAAMPELQDWVAYEVKEVLKDEGPDPLSWKYEALFPRLKRCLSIMLETLRLYGPVTAIPKYTADQAQTILQPSGKSLHVPPRTIVLPNVSALHTHPRYWGHDSLEWRPERWILGTDKNGSLDQEQLFEPPKGAFIPWSEGMRICPGKKFAQVEFVAVMAALFRTHRVEVCPLFPSEELQDIKARVVNVVEDSQLGITLQMRRPGDIHIRVTKT